MTPYGYDILIESAFVVLKMDGKILRGQKMKETSNIPMNAISYVVDIIM